tara:strand:- start:2600 stop:3178 length:579 start_codon:yes stop_codon:yes gene_type:complete
MLKNLYDKVLSLADKPWALSGLAVICFLESSVFPIPPDVLIIPMVLANRSKAFKIVIVSTTSSVLGGMFGYFLGNKFINTIGAKIIDFYHLNDQFLDFSQSFNEYGAIVVLTAGITPLPYKVVTIASGATSMNFVLFSTISLLARGLRFTIVASLLWKYGEPIKEFIEKRLNVLAVLFVALLIAGFFLTGKI